MAVVMSKSAGPAADVSFSRLAEPRGESSSRLGSRSSGQRSDRSARRRKESIERSAVDDDRSQEASSPSQHPQRSAGFLLDPPFTNGHARESALEDRHGKRRADDTPLRVDKRRLAQPRLSGESSIGGSPLSRELSRHAESSEMADEPAYQPSRPQSMDPAQLVQMALSLSEGRRRHVSGPLQVPLSTPKPSRLSSELNTGYGSIGGQAPQDHRASFMREPSPRKSSSPGKARRSRVDGDSAVDAQDLDDIVYPFSPATLSRAEKVRKWFEFGAEYRRLLQYLPPLKPDASAPGNYQTVSKNSPGNTHAHISRVRSDASSKRELGRPYNPLQALRNRRLRARERRPLAAPPEAWHDIDTVKDWVDRVEAAARLPDYRNRPDAVQLPRYAGADGADAAVRDSPPIHRRTDTAGTIITKPENGWSIDPCELLADAYWTETGDSKFLLESRRGNRVFPARFRQVADVSAQTPEQTKATASSTKERDTDTDDKYRGTRRHILPKRHKRPPGMSRSNSTSSVSSVDARKLKRRAYEEQENIGPLERHMQQMIAKDESGELSSPEVVSPDHWDSKHTSFPAFHEADRFQAKANGRLTVDTSFAHRRSRSADARFEAARHPMSSNDDLDSQEPNSPVATTLAPPMGIDLTPPLSKQPDRDRSRMRKLPLFRSHSRERHNIDQVDFAAVPPDLGPEPDRPRSSLDSMRPSQPQRVPTADSYSASLHPLTTATSRTTNTDTSAKESGSSVSRFFKGGRIGELVRTEGSRLSDRFKSRDRSEAAVSGPSNADAADTSSYALSRTATLSADEDDAISPEDTSERGRFRGTFNLPSFNSPASRHKPTRSTDEATLQRQQSNFRAPPQIKLPEKNPWGLATDQSGTFLDEHRKSYGFPSINIRTASGTSLASINHHRSALSSSQKARHWSISDHAHTAALPANRVTKRDLARMKALLLSSGVKAREIRLRAETPSDAAPPFLALAAETAHAPHPRHVPRKDEFATAARLLASALTATTSAFRDSLHAFSQSTAPALSARLATLQQRLVEDLTGRVHDASDAADAFTVALTSKHPQDLKRVDEGIDALLRRRRRQWRVLRRAGFKVLEWLVLAVMWGLWFVVMVLNTLRRVVVGLGKAVGWVIWF